MRLSRPTILTTHPRGGPPEIIFRRAYRRCNSQISMEAMAETTTSFPAALTSMPPLMVRILEPTSAPSSRSPQASTNPAHTQNQQLLNQTIQELFFLDGDRKTCRLSAPGPRAILAISLSLSALVTS